MQKRYTDAKEAIKSNTAKERDMPRGEDSNIAVRDDLAANGMLVQRFEGSDKDKWVSQGKHPYSMGKISEMGICLIFQKNCMVEYLRRNVK